MLGGDRPRPARPGRDVVPVHGQLRQRQGGEAIHRAGPARTVPRRLAFHLRIGRRHELQEPLCPSGDQLREPSRVGVVDHGDGGGVGGRQSGREVRIQVLLRGQRLRLPGDRRAEPGEHDGHMGRGLGDRPVGARRGAPDVIGLPQQRGEPPSRRADRRPGGFPVQCHYAAWCGWSWWSPRVGTSRLSDVVGAGSSVLTRRSARRGVVAPHGGAANLRVSADVCGAWSPHAG